MRPTRSAPGGAGDRLLRVVPDGLGWTGLGAAGRTWGPTSTTNAPIYNPRTGAPIAPNATFPNASGTTGAATYKGITTGSFLAPPTELAAFTMSMVAGTLVAENGVGWADALYGTCTSATARIGNPEPVMVTILIEGARGSGSDANRVFVEGTTTNLVGEIVFFSKIVTQCVMAFLLPTATNCETWDDAQHWISQEWQDYVQAQVEDSIEEVVKAMRAAGYADGSWTFIQHSYPKPIPNSLRFRYPEGFNGRQSIAGCGFYDAAADWAVKEVTPIVGGTVYRAVDAVRTNPRYAGIPMFFMDPQDAFSSHELCAQGVYRLNTPSERERRGPKSWRERGAALDSEWVKDIDALQQEGTEKDESFHPNYWGQLALRNCLRQMWNRGEVLGDGACRIGPRKMTKRGEPKMTVEITRNSEPPS